MDYAGVAFHSRLGKVCELGVKNVIQFTRLADRWLSRPIRHKGTFGGERRQQKGCRRDERAAPGVGVPKKERPAGTAGKGDQSRGVPGEYQPDPGRTAPALK